MTGGVTTHVLDTASGRPGEGIPALLEQAARDADWQVVGRSTTDGDGRATLLANPSALVRGTYRLTLETERYFAGQGVTPFYPVIIVLFRVEHPEEHFHIPILLSPFGFSTYRGR